MKKIFLTLMAISIAFSLRAQIMKLGENVIFQDNSIHFNIAHIHQFDERVFFIYNLLQDERFLVTISEETGTFIVHSNGDNSQLRNDFNSYCQNIQQVFAALSKDEASDLFHQYKKQLSSEYMTALLMDIYMKDRTNNLCANAEPFCTDNGLYTFPAGVNSGEGENGPNYDCLSTRPNPAWYYMKISTPGSLTINMYSTPLKDIDFCCWGPFDDPVAPCPNGLTNSVSCSFSPQATENCIIDNAIANKYYILIITNYSDEPCNISFQKTAGTAATDCSIMPPLISYTDPVCVGGTLRLRAEEIPGASYAWSGPGGWTSNQRAPIRNNVTMNMAGTYTCSITIGSQQSESVALDVEIHPMPVANFTYTQVCKGAPTSFTCTSTTNPTGQQITNRTWDFGDGGTGSGTQVTHTYANSGTYTVTLTVQTDEGACSNTKTQQVVVYPDPVANAGPDQTINYGSNAQLSGSGGAGNFTYHWEPANKVNNPNIQNPQTINLTETQVFTLTVSSSTGGCNDTDQVTIAISGSGMTATAEAEDSELCEGESTQLHAYPIGGSSNYTYHWTPAETLDNPNTQHPVATPNTGTTTYTAHISDGITAMDVQVSILCHPNTTSDIHTSICENESYEFFGQQLNEPGNYTHTIESSHGCDSTITLHLSNYPTFETPISEAICQGDAFQFHGAELTQAGYYTHTLESIHGCDSIIKLTLIVNPTINCTINESTCEHGDGYYFNGQWLKEAGTYTYTGETHHGCDSIVTLNLTITDYNTKYYIAETCDQPYTWISNNHTYDETGLYIDTISGSNCDSIVTLQLNVYPTYDYLLSPVTECDSYTWDGRTYTETGIYPYQYNTSSGCDSTVSLDLTIHHSNETFFSVEDACDSYTWQGQDFLYDAQNVEKILHNIYGCDSTVTMQKLDMEYTPTLNPILGDKWVIAGADLQITLYDYFTNTSNSLCEAEYEWSIWKNGEPFSEWTIEPYGEDNRCCKLYVSIWQNDSIELKVKSHNRCGEDEKSIWLHSSFYGIDENSSPIHVEIVPNPNNGNMTIKFENMEGLTSLKVFNMSGIMIDHIDNYIDYKSPNIEYTLKNCSSGIYYFVISNKQTILTKKVILLNN
jgi:FOG: PKD repeat